MAEKSGGPSWIARWNNRLAKAETLLLLALFSETVIHPWLYSQPIPDFAKTAIKMALIIGLFGPVNAFFSRLIDASLKATHDMTTQKFSMPRVGYHVAVFATLFLAFYWSMHHAMPWDGYQQTFARWKQQATANWRLGARN